MLYIQSIKYPITIVYILKKVHLNSLVYLCCVLSLFRLLQTEWLINNRNLLLMVKEGGKFKIKVWADSVSDEGPFTGSQMTVCPHTVERENSGLFSPL